MDRSHRLLEAAVVVVARDGMNGLTHRAVDREAALPSGSTSNVFRSRADLVRSLIDHILTAETADVAASLPADAVTELWARALGEFAVRAVEECADRSRARLALALDPTSQPAVRAVRESLVAIGEARLEAAGHPRPRAAADLALALVDGAVFAGVAVGRSMDAEQLTAALREVLTPPS